ncbi:MAG TPA: hypothetical protein VFY25_15815 [Anaerolineales bacterium]|nr:hypothetical protein [Anaerolineales bacterium]
MTVPALFSNGRFRTVVAVIIILGALYAIINVFVLGGDDFVFKLNSFIVSPLAALTAILATHLWRQMKRGAQSRFLWGGLFLGWICWAIAESLWAAYSLAGEDPYPSWADMFFLVGYIPLSFGFISRLRGLPRKLEISHQLVVWLISLFVISVTTFFILIPIIQEYDPALIVESLLGLFYPLADLFLLLLVLNLLFTYGPGDYGLGWRLILVGFITVTISDLFFAYSDWNGLYYPDGRANLLSTLIVDVLYSASYVLWSLGIYALYLLLREHRTFTIDFQPRTSTNAHIFLFTNRDEMIIEASQNYFDLFPSQDPCGQSLAGALGLPGNELLRIHDKLERDRKLTDYPVFIQNASGISQKGWLCGLSIASRPHEYEGSIVVLRIFLEEEADQGLNNYEKSLVPYVLERTGSSEYESIRLLFLDYYLAYIKSLFNLTLGEGGAAMSQALLDELQAHARQNDWQLRFNPQTIVHSELKSPVILADALTALLETAKRFVSQLTDEDTVEREMEKIDAQFGGKIHETVQSLRGSMRSIA